MRAWLARHDPAMPCRQRADRRAVRPRRTDGAAQVCAAATRHRAHRSPHCGGANDVWCLDFKGWFLTGDGTHCEPLTLSDARSRYLLRCQASARTDTEHVWPVLDAASANSDCRSGCAPTTAAVCLERRGRLLAAVGQGDQGRLRAGAHCARQAAAERPARTAAHDAAAARPPSRRRVASAISSRACRHFHGAANEPCNARAAAAPRDHRARRDRRTARQRARAAAAPA